MEATVLIRFMSIRLTMLQALSKGLKILVPSGTYYRVRGYHAASNGGLKGIYVHSYTGYYD